MRVFLSTPSSGMVRRESVYSAIQATQGQHEIHLCVTEGFLEHAFNKAWAAALTEARQGKVDYFAMLHSDQASAAGWLDTLIEDAEQTGAAVVGTVSLIKDGSGETSTALETDDPWKPRKLTLDDLADMPAVFSRDDLLLNTGCFVADLRRSEWTDPVPMTFGCESRIVWCDVQQQYVAQLIGEDWRFSREARRRGLKLACSQRVGTTHFGSHVWRFDPA